MGSSLLLRYTDRSLEKSPKKWIDDSTRACNKWVKVSISPLDRVSL